MVFHHDLDPFYIRSFGAFASGERLPNVEALNARVNKARSRFVHTYNSLRSLRSADVPVVFVRWRREGHPDKRYPVAFEGETDVDLIDRLGRFLGHDRFFVLTVESKILRAQYEVVETSVRAFGLADRCATISIAERLGWNGDQSSSFKGDEDSWGRAFEKAAPLVLSFFAP